MPPSLITFSSPDQMADKLADLMEAKLSAAILERGKAVLAVSGGSTPRALHGSLSQRDLEWQTVTALLVDERWVPPGAPGSNETFVRDTLACNKAADIAIAGLYRPDCTAQDAAARVASDVRDIASQIDVLHLGMGPDGHTASWFPGAIGLDHALSTQTCVAAIQAEKSDVTGDLTQRMTLTLAAVKTAKTVVLMLTGTQKRKVLEQALQAGPVEALPVRAILRARPDMWVCWSP